MNFTSLKNCTKCMVAGFIIVAAFCLFAGSSLYHWVSGEKVEAVTTNATVISTPRALQSFSLIDGEGQAFTPAQLQNHWSLVFFGFTACPEMCPTTLAELAKMMKVLEGNHEKTLPQVLMVSVDPEHDDAAAMKKYVTSFDSRFIGLTGKLSEIEALTKTMGIVYMRDASQKDVKDTMIDHSGTLVLLNPKGEITAFFSYPHNAEVIASDLHAIIRAS